MLYRSLEYEERASAPDQEATNDVVSVELVLPYAQAPSDDTQEDRDNANAVDVDWPPPDELLHEESEEKER